MLVFAAIPRRLWYFQIPLVASWALIWIDTTCQDAGRTGWGSAWSPRALPGWPVATWRQSVPGDRASSEPGLVPDRERSGPRNTDRRLDGARRSRVTPAFAALSRNRRPGRSSNPSRAARSCRPPRAAGAARRRRPPGSSASVRRSAVAPPSASPVPRYRCISGKRGGATPAVSRFGMSASRPHQDTGCGRADTDLTRRRPTSACRSRRRSSDGPGRRRGRRTARSCGSAGRRPPRRPYRRPSPGNPGR